MATKPTIEGIIAIFHATIMICKATKGVSVVPQSCCNVAARLPIVQDTLERALAVLEGEGEVSAARSRQALTKMLDSCFDKAVALQKILGDVMPTSTGTLMRSPIYAIKAFQYSKRIDKLMNDIQEDIQLVAANSSIRMATGEQVCD